MTQEKVEQVLEFAKALGLIITIVIGNPEEASEQKVLLDFHNEFFTRYIVDNNQLTYYKYDKKHYEPINISNIDTIIIHKGFIF